jgi:cysteine-rich repeat protein
MKRMPWVLIVSTVLGCGSTGGGSAAARCGDGVRQAGEECDDGENNSNTLPGACRTTCLLGRCGDRVRDPGEECDEGNQTAACDLDCTLAMCGDGTLNQALGEDCDDGARNSDTVADACRTDCQPARCGDGTIDTGEACDDGAGNSDTAPDACRTDCALPSCGDGVLDSAEECDDGTGNSDTLPDACRTDCRGARCGDGVQDSGEPCDDGNAVDGDGCNADCVISGTVLWTRTVDGLAGGDDDGIDIATDLAGNAAVVGDQAVAGQGRNIWVRKYDPDGGTLWTRGYNGSSSGDDFGVGVDFDSGGDVLVAGTEAVAGEGENIWVRKYDPDGATLWTRTYNGAASGDDEGRCVAADADGNVLVAGLESVSGEASNVWVRKYDPDGATLWTRTYNGPANGDDLAMGIVADAGKNVLVAGAETVAGEDYNVWVRKYDADGATLWTRTYNGPASGADIARDVAVDSAGDYVVAGGATDPVRGYDVWVRKYDADGTTLWTRTYSGADGGEDLARGVAVDPDDNVIAAGYEFVAASPYDVWLRKYDAAGATLWTRGYDGAFGGNDSALGVAADLDGNVWVVGVEGTASGSDIWVRKYAP